MQMNICAEKRKPRTIFLNVEITIQNSTPIKAPSSVLPQAFPLEKKKKFLSVFCISYLFAHASAGVCFVSVYQFEVTSTLPRMCIHV